jgi:glycosyltransferase involved in cell wall biosynthesis
MSFVGNDSIRASELSHQYCVITACRDEALYARVTLNSIVKQSLRPALWVIVDDGSTDSTPQILADYVARHSWIRVIHRADRGYRKVGEGVIEAFYAGYDTIDPDQFDFICKLDLDLELPVRYFELLIERMIKDPRIGTASGKAYMVLGRRRISEKCGDETSAGMVKFYRMECFKQIGGFVPALMWDGIDCHRCRMLGWVAVSWDDPELRFDHLRPMGTSYKTWWTGRVRHGVGQYYMGTIPPYMLASVLFRMTRPPVFFGGLAIAWGYVRSWLTRHERYEDATFRKFLRSYQWNCLLRGKRWATEYLNAVQADRWRQDQRR